MGCTRQYIYKLVANGKLKASRLSSRMAFVRKADIEKMFEGNPHKRVIPASKSKLSKKAKTEKPTQKQESTKGKEENEMLDYYSGEEVMSIYKVKNLGSTPPPSVIRYRCVVLLARTVTANGILMSSSVLPLTLYFLIVTYL